MLGISRNKHNKVKGALSVLPGYAIQVLSFGKLGWRGRFYRRRNCPLRWSYGGLGACLVLVLSFGYFDSDWIYRSVRTKR